MSEGSQGEEYCLWIKGIGNKGVLIYDGGIEVGYIVEG
jgi:hypothetical protein